MWPNVTGYEMQQLDQDELEINWTTFGQMNINPQVPELTENKGTAGESKVILTQQERPATAIYKVAQALTDLLQNDANTVVPKPPTRRTQLFRSAVRTIKEGLDYGYITVQEDKIWAAAHEPHINELTQRLAQACLLKSPDERPAIKAISQTPPFYSTSEIYPYWSSRKDRLETRKSQLNIAPCGNSWELRLAQILDNHPNVVAWARNDRQRWELPYMHQGEWQHYEPDFVARIELSDGDKMNLVIEVKGQERDSDLDKSRYANEFWVPSVNSDPNLSQHGQWQYLYVEHPAKAHMMIDQLAGITGH